MLCVEVRERINQSRAYSNDSHSLFAEKVQKVETGSTKRTFNRETRYERTGATTSTEGGEKDYHTVVFYFLDIISTVATWDSLESRDIGVIRKREVEFEQKKKKNRTKTLHFTLTFVNEML